MLCLTPTGILCVSLVNLLIKKNITDMKQHNCVGFLVQLTISNKGYTWLTYSVRPSISTINFLLEHQCPLISPAF